MTTLMSLLKNATDLGFSKELDNIYGCCVKRAILGNNADEKDIVVFAAGTNYPNFNYDEPVTVQINVDGVSTTTLIVKQPEDTYIKNMCFTIHHTPYGDAIDILQIFKNGAVFYFKSLHPFNYELTIGDIFKRIINNPNYKEAYLNFITKEGEPNHYYVVSGNSKSNVTVNEPTVNYDRIKELEDIVKRQSIEIERLKTLNKQPITKNIVNQHMIVRLRKLLNAYTPLSNRLPTLNKFMDTGEINRYDARNLINKRVIYTMPKSIYAILVIDLTPFGVDELRVVSYNRYSYEIHNHVKIPMSFTDGGYDCISLDAKDFSHQEFDYLKAIIQ